APPAQDRDAQRPRLAGRDVDRGPEMTPTGWVAGRGQAKAARMFCERGGLRMTSREALRSWQLTPADLAEVARMQFGDLKETGPVPRLWHRVQYFSPDTGYEALVAKLVQEQTAWLDVGCGRNVFPSNARLAEVLAKRCKLLVGVDPDQTVEEN